MTPSIRSLARRLSPTCAVLLALVSATLPAAAHTLSIMRVTPGKLVAGDTATIAAKFDLDDKACAVEVDFGDGSAAWTTAIAAAGSDVPLSVQHVYAQAGAYMISIVPVADKGTPKCGGGKHSTLIDVLEAAGDPAPH